MRKIFFFSLLLMLFAVGAISCEGVSVNKSIQIDDGETVRNDLSSVNGDITIGDNCKVMGDCNSVNGAVQIGENSQVDDIGTVNGSISVGKNSIVHEDLESVNGSITCEAGVKVRGEINTINGSLELFNTEVERNITTVNGSINLNEQTLVMGNIEVEVKGKILSGNHKVKIHVRDHSVVEGDIIGDENVVVEVYLENGSEIKGKVHNAQLIKE